MNAPNDEEAIFAEALRLQPEERAAYLAQATHGNAALRQRIEALLGSYPAGDFLEAAAAPQVRPPLMGTVPPTEKPGDRVGRYKLLERIGEGGCGVVYVAEQTEPVRRRVALKIVKLGMDTRSVIARFEAERQALALMDHPNIAKVFDAGATDTGRPYFVMELVRGLKITDFCDEKRLTTDARLDLFIRVCQAIQHAHQKGIIHRDIKPSNILVTMNDGVAVPKVIDFGVAKATGGQVLTDKTIYTAFEQFIGTPAYMSPEQAVLTSLDIDTRSDIYALGVLLYELLTGRTPFDARELLAIGLEEMRRTIREAEPPRPSTRVSTLPGQELSTTAQRRSLEAPKLVSELRGDLDWIVMKCLEKDRARRYDTANDLAADIQRHLGNEPVIAGPPGTFYRFQKFVRRNKLVFSASTAIFAALVIGLGISTWMFLQERAAVQRAVTAEGEQSRLREESEEHAAMAEAGNDFLWDILAQASSRWQADTGFMPDPDLTVREALDRAAERIDQFKDRPLSEAFVRHTIGRAYYDLDDPKRAMEHLERALELLEAKSSNNPRNTNFAKGRLEVMNFLGGTYCAVEEFDKAFSISQEALEDCRLILGPDDLTALDAMRNLADSCAGLGKFDEAIRRGNEALDFAKARLGPDDPGTLMAREWLARIYQKSGKPELALPLAQETLTLCVGTLGPDHPSTLYSMCRLGEAHLHTGRPDQAKEHYEEALRRMKDILGADHPRTLEPMYYLAQIHSRAGRHDEATELLKEALRLAKIKLGPEGHGTFQIMDELAGVYPHVGKLDEALDLAEETLNLREAKLGPEHPDTLASMATLGRICTDNGRLAQALPIWEKVVELSETTLGRDHVATLKRKLNLGRTYGKMGRPDKAIPLIAGALEAAKGTFGEDAPDTLDAMALLGIAFMQAEKPGQAVPVFADLVELSKHALGPNHPKTIASKQHLGASYLGAGELEKGLFWLEEAVNTGEAALADNLGMQQAMVRLAELLARQGRWQKAAVYFERLCDLVPDDHEVWHKLAALYVASGQAEAYRDHCRRSAERFGDTTNPVIAERIAKDCLTLPNSGADPGIVSQMANTAATITAHPLTPWFQFTEGLAEYRQGHFASAIEWLNKTLAEAGNARYRDVEAYMVLTMAHYQLKHADEARAAFAKGTEIERTKLPRLESGDIGAGWLDWIISHALMDEAKALIEGGVETVGDAK